MNLAWLSDSWWHLLPKPWGSITLTIIAVLCGILIGGERQRREKPAGLRTVCLVCLGSAVFTMISVAFTSTTGDSGRVAAQIVTGIGFLGAGVILHGTRTVSGMTTAATIWMTAAIGMVVGAGYAMGGLALSILVNRMLVCFFLYETKWHPDLRRVRVVLQYEPMGGLTRVRLERVMVDYSLTGGMAEWSESRDKAAQLTLQLKLARVHLCEFLDELADVPNVHSIEQHSEPPK
jgi:putative Mg2+ transporter-C (MgtC) family protein